MTFRVEPRGWRLLRVDHDAPGERRDIRISCEFCARPLPDGPLRGPGPSFRLPGGEWRRFEMSVALPRNPIFIRRALDSEARRAKGGVLTLAEDGHIYMAMLGVGPVSEVGRRISSGRDLRDFMEREMEAGRMAARREPGRVTVLRGPDEGQPGCEDFAVDARRFLPDPMEARRATIEGRAHRPGGGRAFVRRRRACVDPATGTVLAADFSDTRLLDDADADARAAGRGSPADIFPGSASFARRTVRRASDGPRRSVRRAGPAPAEKAPVAGSGPARGAGAGAPLATP